MRNIIHYASGPDTNVKSGYWLYDQIENDGFDIKSYYIYRYGHLFDFSSKFRKYILPLKLWLNSNKGDTVILYDITSVFIYFGLLVWLFRLDRKIVSINFMGSGSMDNYSWLKCKLIHFALSVQKVGVNNEVLRDNYAKLFNLPRSQFYLIKDCINNVDTSIVDTNPSNPHYIFMGGNTHRDWSLFKKVVEHLSEYCFVAALNGPDLDDLHLDNLKVYKNLSLSEFNKLIAKSKMVFLPLQTQVQGGQLVAFQASCYKKPLVITQTIGLDSYYGENDVIKLKSNDSMESIIAIRKIMGNDMFYKEYSEKAYKKLITLTPESIYSVIKQQILCLH